MGGPPLEFITIQPPKRGLLLELPLEFVKQMIALTFFAYFTAAKDEKYFTNNLF